MTRTGRYRSGRATATAARVARGGAALGRSSMTSRFARRIRRRRLARMAPVLALVGVLLLAGFVFWLVAFSSLLSTRSVAVVGLTRESGLSAGEVRAAAAVPLGRPLARVDVSAVGRRVARLPAVEGVTVSRSWPHEIRIEVDCREPVALWRDGSVLRVVDAEGVAFRTADGLRGNFPTIELHSKQKDPQRLAELRATGAQIAAALPARLRRQVDVMRVRTVDSVELELDPQAFGRDVTVVWGSAKDSAAKARVLTVLLKRPASVYDVSVPSFPTTKA